MPLTFEERSDGFRVLDGERMIASMETKRIDPKKSKVNPETNPFGGTVYEEMPRAECYIHSAGGKLSVVHLEEMLAKLPAV